MNKRNVTRILIVISVFIMIVGVVGGILASNELKNVEVSDRSIYIDGTDFTSLIELFVYIGSSIIGFAIGMFSAIIVAIIWIIYGVIVLIVNIINKIKIRYKQSI